MNEKGYGIIEILIVGAFITAVAGCLVYYLR